MIPKKTGRHNKNQPRGRHQGIVALEPGAISTRVEEPAGFVHFCTFAAERNRVFPRLRLGAKYFKTDMSENRFHTRQAAAALLKMARTTSDPKVAAGLVEVAASLQEQAGELPPAVNPRAPDIRTEG